MVRVFPEPRGERTGRPPALCEVAWRRVTWARPLAALRLCGEAVRACGCDSTGTARSVAGAAPYMGIVPSLSGVTLPVWSLHLLMLVLAGLSVS
jgi:hypothetical protein